MAYNKTIGPIDRELQKYPWYSLLPDYRLPRAATQIDKFFRTMFERQEVWYRRHILQESHPWTTDPILRDYKFTNVYRQLDRSSTWLVNNVLQTPDLHPHDVIWQIIAYRLFNKPDAFEWGVQLPTYAAYAEPEVQTDFSNQMDNYVRITRGNPFTSSFYINCTNCDGYKKLDCYTRRELPRIHAMIPKIHQALLEAEASHNPHHLIATLIQLPRVSHFNAHEFYQDFCYHATYAPPLTPALTRLTQMDYTNVGPGASVGLRLLYPNDQTKEQQTARLTELHRIAAVELAKYGDFKFAHWNAKLGRHVYKPEFNLTLHQMEMWACELCKYFKMEHRLGRQRSKYVPK